MTTACSNCFNGCTDIKSDKCIKYTGVDIPVLGIQNGDSLSYVEQSLIGFLVSTLDGNGIKPDIDPTIICDLIKAYLPDCGDITIVDIVTALIKSVCDLRGQLDDSRDILINLEEDYTIGCIPGVVQNAGTHAILQAVITKVCEIDSTLTALALELSTSYVKLSDLNDLIDIHLQDSSTLVKNKMIPYVAVEYYGSLSYFDMTGAGTGDWINIYLCNGNNGTPDKRGRVPVGTTTGMGGPAFNPVVDPGIAGNPAYSLQSIGGANNIVLSASQMPSHTHSATAVVTELPHFHYEFSNEVNGAIISSVLFASRAKNTGSTTPYQIEGTSTIATLGKSSLASTGLSVGVTNAPIGGNLSHSNIQPVLACHYIIYIP